MKNQALELHSPLPKSFKVCKERTMEKRKTEDSSCSLLSHFWSTSRSPFFTYYIPFQRSGSQESNASNCVRFRVEMRKIWPSEDNCIMPNDQFRKEIFLMVRNLAISHHEDPPCEISQSELTHDAKIWHFAS